MALTEELLADERIVVRTGTYAKVTTAYGEAGKYDEALTLFFMAYNPRRTIRDGRWLVHVITAECKEVEPWEAAVKVLTKMESKESSRPSASIYKAVIEGCRKAGQWEKAVETLRKISKTGVRPNGTCYLHAIRACQEYGQEEIAVALTKESRATIEPVTIY